MADGTVRGAFDLNVEQPLRGLRSIRTAGGQADAMLRQLGGTMDRMGGATANAKLDDYEKRVRKIGTAAETTTARVDASWGSQRRSIERESDRIELRVGRLESRVERYGRQRASARVELDGAAKVQGELLALERRLAAFGRSRSTATVGSSGGGLGGLASTATAGGGAGGGGGFGTAAKLAIGGAALLPGVQGLLGGATALVGSAAGATLGAGAIGIGAAGTLGVGAALSAGVAKPAIKELQELDKAQEKYRETVRKFGQTSKQAAVGRRELLNVERVAGPAGALASRQISLTERAFRSATAPGRAAFFGGIGNAAIAARGAAPTIGRAANIASTATAGAITNFATFLTGPQSQRTVMGLTQEFAHDLPVTEHTLENIVSTLEHLAMAGRPFFREANEWVQTWTHGLASSTGNEARVQTTMRGLVAETKDWGHLAGATFHTLRDIFELGRPSGDSMVVSLTQTLDRWDAWIQRNPAKVQGFFREAENTTGKIAEALVSITHLLGQAATALTPIFNRAAGLVKVLGALGPGTTTAASALLYGGYSAFRGSSGGRAPSAGALVATGVFGRSLRSGGAGGGAMRADGGVLASDTSHFLMPTGGATGRAATGTMPLFITRSSGEVVPNIARTSRGAATPEGFAARYGGVEGAHYAAPVSTIEAGRGPGRLRSALGGGVKTVGATLAIVGALEALGKGGSTATVAQNFASSATLGLVHPVDTSGSRGAARASTFLAGIPNTTALSSQQAVIERKIARSLVPFSESGGILNPLGGTTATPTPVRAGQRGFIGQARADAEAVSEVGPHGRNIGTEVKALLVRWQELRDTAKEAKRAQTEALDARSISHGERLGSQLGGAFNVERAHGRTVTGAFGDVTGGALSSMKQMRTAGAKVLGENTLAWAHQLAKGNPELKKPVEELTDQIADRFRKLNRNVQIVNGHILTGSREQWESISTAMSEPIEKARERMSKSFTAIQREAVGALVAMGFNKKGAEAVVAGQEKGGKSAGQITSGVASAAAGAAGKVVSSLSGKGNARGGMIGGHGMLDTVPVPGGMAAPGEGWIANRHTLADISAATVEKYGLTAQQMITSEHRPHSARGRYATGGFVAGPGTNYSVGSEPQIAADLNRLGQYLHRTLTGISGYRSPAHSVAVGGFPDDPHTRGEASDTPGTENIPESLLERFGLTRPFPGAAEADHMQLLGGGKGAGARGSGALAPVAAAVARAIHLKRRKSGMRGVPGALADAGISSYTRALQGRVNAHLHAQSNFAGVPGRGGAPSANEALGRAMMLAAGWGASEWPSLKALWTQESGWDANSVNSSSGAYGIPQALGHGHPFNLGDARAQIAWGLNYIKGRYGSPSGAEAHERSFNWYGEGGSFLTNGPTVFGAGERGRERVNITPLGRGEKGGGHTITVNIGHVSMRSDADVDKVAKQVASKILDEMDAVGAGVHDQELLDG